jgi:hypothetical protein
MEGKEVRYEHKGGKKKKKRNIREELPGFFWPHFSI